MGRLDKIHKSKNLEEVKSLLKGEWEVIDGQQRLTTVYLILKELSNDSFRLKYQRDNYIETCDKSTQIEKDNAEIFYLTTAKDTIHTWIKNNIETSKDKFKEKLLNYCKFIWYDVGDLDESQTHALFNNLNSGKIALTNAELIKALFLNKVDIQQWSEKQWSERYVQQRIIAEEFDQMERTIRQDDFWYFIAGNAEKPSSCINLLFDLMLDSDKDKRKEYPKEEAFSTFFYFNARFKEEKGLWEEVQNYFHILEGWFSDSELYNLIGYLRSVRSEEETSLSDLYKLYKNKGRVSEFKQELKERCKKCITTDENDFENLRYDENKDKVFNLLLLFNIATLNAKPEEKNRFSFANFHKNKWDVEHISPQNPKNDEDLRRVIEKSGNPIFDELGKALKNKDEDKLKEEKSKFFAEDDALMSLRNLTLLTAHDNRGIRNGFFFQKREQLKNYFQQGSFIPICSMNVFMKFYSERPEQMEFWDTKDQESYFNIIKDTINKF